MRKSVLHGTAAKEGGDILSRVEPAPLDNYIKFIQKHDVLHDVSVNGDTLALSFSVCMDVAGKPKLNSIKI